MKKLSQRQISVIAGIQACNAEVICGSIERHLGISEVSEDVYEKIYEGLRKATVEILTDLEIDA